MSFIREYLIMFVILYIINIIILFFIKRKFKKNKSVPLLFYLKKLYNIKMNKSIYNKYIWLFAFINTFIIDTSYMAIIYLLKNNILRFIFGIIIIILLIIICYGIFARVYLWKEGNKDV